MFMCDKAPVQRELAENLAGLLSLFKDDRAEGVRFFKSFCVTMQRDWERIDNLRIDKYYTLVRVFVREALAFCRLPPPAVEGQPKHKKKRKGKKNTPAEEAETSAKAGGVWDLGLLGAMSDVMEVEVLTLRPAPIGLRLHLADVWAEEACNAGGADMPTEAFLVALAPWLRVAAEPETNPVVFRRTFEGVFEGLLGLFPEDKDGMEEEEEEEKVFAAVELDRVQACLFEVAAAPQTRDKRRVKLYELHRRYQKRTGVAPDASAPPSGILPLPDESDDDEDEEGGGDGEYDGEYVEAGARRRAVRGPEPAVAGWVAAGIASGDISSEGGAEGGGKKAKKRRKRSGSEDDEAEVDGGGEKKRRRSGEEEEQEEEEEAGAKKKKKKSRGSVEKDSADAAAAEAPAAAPAGVEAGAGAEAEAETPGKNGTKKRKKEEASPPGGASNGFVTVEGTVVAAAGTGDGVSSPPSSGKRKKKKKRRGSADGVATVARDDAAAAVSMATATAPEVEVAAANGDGVSSPPSSGKRKKKNKERVSADGVATDAGDDVAAAVSMATAAAPEAEAAAPADGVEASPSSSKKKKKGKGEEEVAMPDAGESETTPEDDATTTPDSSSEKKKKKKKKKRPSLEAVASPTPPPGNTASEEDSAPSSGSFQTPPKNAGGGGGSSSKKKKKSPAAGESARKTVTFGANMAKEHQTSVKDLKTRVITPSKDAGTPQKGLLKVGGGGSGVKLMKPSAGRKDTPYVGKKKASDYF
ncbi:unnamed protein product [Ectocarpus sp. 12 AP-2014]